MTTKDKAATAPENMVLEHLRTIRGKLDSIAEKVDDLRDRTTGVEASIAGLRKDLANGADVDARHQVNLDKIVKRLERIESRLDLQDA